MHILVHIYFILSTDWNISGRKPENPVGTYTDTGEKIWNSAQIETHI